MAYDSVRAQLDKLLGPDRNGPLTGAKNPPILYTDPSVCKHFLLGFCPHDLHIKHRSEPGSCAKQHLATAKTEFEKDRDDGRIKDELSRWKRDLLSDCRAILEDEERKIRGHARRLQDTYKARGDLAGLMIKNFDTLKKLGMVSSDATIKVLSEMDDFDDGFDVQDEGKETTKVTEEVKDKTADVSKSIVVENASGNVEGKTADKGDSSSDQDDTGADDDDDDDDLDGFGIIKVIPADKDIENKPAEEPLVKKHKNQPIESKPSETKLQIEKKHVGTDPTTSTSEDVPQTKSEDAAANTTENTGSNEKEEKKPHKSSDKVSVQVTEDNLADNGNPIQPSGSEGEVSHAEPEDKMEEFYKSGLGPDGLLMLDRKQSLRVCACCGGFISLVDAESRLLSHYGGKSHHSLAQLREKAAELEKEVAADRRYYGERASYDFPRGRRDDREPYGSRRDNYRRDDYRRDERYSRNTDRPDRYRDRHDRDSGRRGYGTTDWYDRSRRGRDDYRRDDRSDRRDGDHLRRDRQDDRYESGRKRHRTRSPSYSRQRPRHY